MSWKVTYTPEARQDLMNIYSYIAMSLSEPGAAKKQTQHIMTEIDSLDTFPLRYPVYPNEPWTAKGLGYFPVGNFLVFYLPKEGTETAHIVWIMYGGRDIENQI